MKRKLIRVAASPISLDLLLKGQLKSKEHIVEGLESFPESLAKLFSGENFGKLVLKV